MKLRHVECTKHISDMLLIVRLYFNQFNYRLKLKLNKRKSYLRAVTLMSSHVVNQRQNVRVYHMGLFSGLNLRFSLPPS